MTSRVAPPVLIAMAEACDLDLLETAFRHDGLPVLLAPDGETALELLRQRSPGLVVVDLMLPWVGALQVIGEASAKRLPVLVFTALDDAEHHRQAFEAGAMAIFRKGDGLCRLREAVRREALRHLPRRRPGVAEARAQPRGTAHFTDMG